MKNLLLLPALTLLAGAALAAGGHHAVDDAALADPGTCDVEGWFARASAQHLLHAGFACRAGPVELGASAERSRHPAGDGRAWNLESKWAQEVSPEFALGLSMAVQWAAHESPRFQGHTAVALATWKPREDVVVHANLGRDFQRGAGSLARAGAAAEWAVSPGWTATFERYVEEKTHFLRAGLRWAFAPSWTVDASRAQSLRGPRESTWTVGIARAIER